MGQPRCSDDPPLHSSQLARPLSVVCWIDVEFSIQPQYLPLLGTQRIEQFRRQVIPPREAMVVDRVGMEQPVAQIPAGTGAVEPR